MAYLNDNAGFCVWVAGKPASVVAAIARAVALELAHHRRVEELDSGPDNHLVQALSAPGVAFVVRSDLPSDNRRAEVRRAVPRLIEVHVGRQSGGERAPDVAVPGDGARAGESARVVLRHLAAAGYSEALDEYSDDDEAAVSGRLQNFGYL